ncbi:MAG: UDP-N-acetylmuramoyl-L-alanine--D-glutamate ligase [Firmicutes bacterium]|nr:UDP-N-acetylmuramoyl-L-alanine--D-glutamate ligase [Bacillota bacterium]
MIENKKILVLGMARSGYHVAKLLASKNKIIVTDRSEQKEELVNELTNLGVTFIKNDTGIELLDDSIDLLIKNPGIEPTHPCVKKAMELGIPIVNEMEVAYHYLPANTKIIGITGSNGKTTTTTILYNLLKLHNIDAILGGNIGYPLSEVVATVKDNSVLVLEISDHQLFNLQRFKTDISILTNLCPTHLDFHGNYENYINVKKKIFNHHDESNKAFINFKNEDSLKITKDIKSKKIYFNNEANYYDEKGIYIDGELVVSLKNIKIKGSHNYENILAALMGLKEFAFDKEIIKNYLQNFNGVEHRIEVVDANIEVDFYNDSKATNPTSTLTALKTMTKPTRLILGGMERNQDFNELNDEINIVSCIYAIGEVTDRIAEYALSKNIQCVKCYTLDKAMEYIKKDLVNGEAVLLSPASASWDQYDKFETRGEEFKKLVENLFE